METGLAATASVIMPGQPLSVLAFGCTSATMVIGEEGVFARLREARPEARPTTPITAAFAAFRAVDARRLAVLTPYRPDVNESVRRYIEARGSMSRCSGRSARRRPPRSPISVRSIRDAAIDLGRDPRVDAVFVACTSLRVAGRWPRSKRPSASPSRRATMPWPGTPCASPKSPIRCEAGDACSLTPADHSGPHNRALASSRQRRRS